MIDIQRDESFPVRDLDNRTTDSRRGGRVRDGELIRNPSSPKSISTDADQYMAVSTESVFPETGFNAYATTESYASVPIPDAGMYVYAESIVDEGLTSYASRKEIRQSSYDNKTQVAAAHVAMHELGYSFGACEADDKGYGLLPFEEGYSGRKNDPTPELVGGDIRWSIMTARWRSEVVHTHNQSLYYAFSIEEGSTMDRP